MLLAVLVVLAAGSAGQFGYGPASAGERERPDLIVATSPETQVTSQAYAVALDAIAANLEADPAVASARVGKEGADQGRAVVTVNLAGADLAERRRVAEEIQTSIDPGPLQVFTGGRIGELIEAESIVRGDLWRAELLLLPLALLLIVAVLGLRMAAGPVACSAIAVAGGLVGLRLTGGLADPTALAIVPTALVGLALGIELPTLLSARWEDESRISSPLGALRDTLVTSASPMAVGAFAATAGAAGLLATAYEPAASIALGCALAAAFAVAACVLVMPALFSLASRRAASDGAMRERRLAGALGVLPRLLARGGARTALGLVVTLVAFAALARPALEGDSAPLAARDLAAGSEAARAAKIATGVASAGPARGDSGQAAGGPGDLGPAPDRPGYASRRAAAVSEPGVGEASLFARLPLAGLFSAALLAGLFWVRSRSLFAIPFALGALLPAAAACGILVAVFQEGGLGFADLPSGAISSGALAVAVAALTAIAAARGAIAFEVVHAERELDPGAPGVAERTAGLTLPPVLLGTAIAGAVAIAAVAVDLAAAQQLGVAFAGGLAVDALLLRPIALAALARWQPPRLAAPVTERRLALPRWPRREKTETGTAASAS